MLTRSRKEEIVKELEEKLSQAKGIIFANYRGLKVGEITSFRKKLFEKGMEFKIAKNTLLRIALKEKKIELPEEILNLPLAFIVGTNDEIETSKETYQFAKESEDFEILGAVYKGKFVNAETINQLALLPSREELEARLVGSLISPLQRLVYSLKANPWKLINILKTI